LLIRKDGAYLEMAYRKNLIQAIKEEKEQFLVLIKHFFNRFFENDDISFESNAKQKLLTVLVLLGILGGGLSHSLLKQYIFSPDGGTPWIEKCFFITFFMIVMGFLSILEWEAIFLDSRDYHNLALLPIKTRTLFSAKFFSLLCLMSLFFFSITVLSSILFPLYLIRPDNFNILLFARYCGVHFLSCFSAYFFIFLACSLLNGILMLSVSFYFYQKLSACFQVFFLIIFSFTMVLFVAFFKLYPEMYSSWTFIKENNSIILYVLPSFWFVGLYESLLGNKEPFFNSLAYLSIIATFLVLFLYLWIATLSYKKHLKCKKEIRKKTANSRKHDKVFIKMFNMTFLKDLVQRAVFYFFNITLRRVKKYKLILGGYAAIPLSLFLVLLVTLDFNLSYEDFLIHEKLILSLPHILTLFLVFGARVISNFPESVEANWIFKLTEINNRGNYITGLKKGVFFMIVLPSFLLLFAFYLILLPGKDAALYCLYGLLNSLIVIEIIFFNYSKIPFTCTYISRKLNTTTICVIIIFLSYVYIASTFGYNLLKNPHIFPFYSGTVAFILIMLKILRKYVYKENNELLYEESSKFSGLDLE